MPGGVQRLSKPGVGDPDELCSESLATGEEFLAVGDGALRYATAAMARGCRVCTSPAAESAIASVRGIQERVVGIAPDGPGHTRRPEQPDQLQELTRVEVGEAGLAYPSAGSLVQLAHARALREEFIKPWELAPVYLRKADAEINWQARDRLAGAGAVDGTLE